MLTSTLARLRLAGSLAFGWPFSTRALHHIIKTLPQNLPVTQAGRAMPELDEPTRRALALRRFRAQAKRAARETPYYQALFEQSGLDLARLDWQTIAALPLTTKAALQNQPDAFVSRNSRPFLRATTTGTTSRPTSLYFSAHELQVYAAVGAISTKLRGDIGPGDIVQISTHSRGMLGNLGLAGACAHVGVQVYQTGLAQPAEVLGMLSEKRQLVGYKSRSSVLYTYPSYLGRLVEYGLGAGYTSSDFGLKRVIVGGEIVTKGLMQRSEQLFGPVKWVEGYGNSEVWPFSGRRCEHDHLHFDPSQGLLEVYNPETKSQARPGEVGSLVVTPFGPYRQTTLLLRYDTGDMVRMLTAPPTCSLRSLPATSLVLGKAAFCLPPDTEASGWTFPRDVLEALEANEAVPLPARWGMWAGPDGLEVEVLTRADNPEVHRSIENSLATQGLNVAVLHLRNKASELRQPIPLRGDLPENE